MRVVSEKALNRSATSNSSSSSGISANRLAVAVPCHRVVCDDGGGGGYEDNVTIGFHPDTYEPYLFAYNDNIILDLCEYTAKYNLTSTEDVEMPFEPYYHPKYGWHEKVSADGKGRARPGWELLYNHYAKVKGMNAPYSQAFAEKERPEGYGERGTAEAGDLGFGT